MKEIQYYCVWKHTFLYSCSYKNIVTLLKTSWDKISTIPSLQYKKKIVSTLQIDTIMYIIT